LTRLGDTGESVNKTEKHHFVGESEWDPAREYLNIVARLLCILFRVRVINLLYFMSYDMTHIVREQCAQFFVCCCQSSAVIAGRSSDGAHLISRSKLDAHTVYLAIAAYSAKAVLFYIPSGASRR